mgnify:CR=1 FL=1
MCIRDRIKRALISVFDKTDIVKLAKSLAEHGIEIVSTGGTARLLVDNNIEVTQIDEITKFPEVLGGRVKTLHPNIYAGLLSRLNNSDDKETIKEFNAFIKNPLFKQNDHVEMLNDLSKKFNFNPILNKFLNFLVSKRRLFYLDKILKDFVSYCSFKRGEVDAKLISAKELKDDEVEKIKKDLFAKFGSKINLDYKVDKDLISGLIIQVGSIMIDNSMKNKLKQIKSKMIEV